MEARRNPDAQPANATQPVLFDAVVRPHRWLSGLGFAVLMATVGVVIFDEHPGVAEFVVLATMLGVLVLIGGQSNKPSTSAIP